MAHRLYLRPIGFLYGATADAAVREGLALALAGSAIAFTAAELIEAGPRKTKRRLLSAPELAASKDADLAQTLGRVTRPRPPFAGLSLDRPRLMGALTSR